MAWRNVMIGNPARLSLAGCLLLVERHKQPSVTLSLEDIGSIVLDSPQITLTEPLLAALGKEGIGLIVCDEKHMPCGVQLPFHQHSRTLRAFQLQLSSSLPFMKNCWRLIVKQKIINQAACMALLGLDGAADLLAMAERVKSGDSDNRESVAAVAYFSELFPGLRRRESNSINDALNYGYAIMRSMVARYLTAYGFQPALGIHHRNELNPFNLADDFVEPFRPVVDLWVYRNIGSADSFEQTHRIQLVNLMGCLMSTDSGRVTVQRAADLLCSSYVTACREKKPELLQRPQLIELQMAHE